VALQVPGSCPSTRAQMETISGESALPDTAVVKPNR
tara:strand:+ start:39616 stop:39723 length:108 start_codon:yes stop_codon:yes gene_type:complete